MELPLVSCWLCSVQDVFILILIVTGRYERFFSELSLVVSVRLLNRTPLWAGLGKTFYVPLKFWLLLHIR